MYVYTFASLIFTSFPVAARSKAFPCNPRFNVSNHLRKKEESYSYLHLRDRVQNKKRSRASPKGKASRNMGYHR